MKKYVLIFGMSFLPGLCFSQDVSPITDTVRNNALNVYMESNIYIRQEIPFVNYVRDLKVADLNIVTTTRTTGSGGASYTYFLIGQNRYHGMNDTLTITRSPDDTEETLRVRQVGGLKMALMRYVLKTPLARYIDIKFTQPVLETISTDKWNSWIFRLSLSGAMNGEKSFNTSNLNGNLSAARITEKNKLVLACSYEWYDNNYIVGEEKIDSYSRNQYANVIYVHSINDHWSLGASTYASSSVFHNSRFSVLMRPAVEYNIFPYSAAARRQFTLQYGIGYEYWDYRDTTIYNKTRELLGSNLFTATYQIVEEWGSVNASVMWRNYLQDWSKYNLGFAGSISLRITKGLAFNLAGGVSLVHDQLSLRKSGATIDEVLLRRKEIATQYTYFTTFGLSYTFGSIYNNVVNIRFGN